MSTASTTPNTSDNSARSTRRRWPRWAVIALLVLMAATAGWWRYRVTRPDYRLARGEEAIRTNDWEQVNTIIDTLEATGRTDEAHLLRGKAYYARKRPDLALAEFDAIRDPSPRYLTAATQAGRCLLDLGALKEAAQVFSLVIEQQPDNVDANRGLAAVAYDLGQLNTAIDHLEVVARLDPGDGRPHRLIGLIYKDMGQHEKAEAAYREALLRGLPSPVDGEVQKELAESLVALHRFADALVVLDKLQAEDGGTIASRASALRGIGRSTEAAELLDRAVTRFPAGPLYRIRGQLALDAGDHAGAVRPLERAVELAPVDYRAHFLLAQAYAGVQRGDDAKREAERAEQIRQDLDKITELTKQAMERPWDAGIRLQLAELSDRLGMPEVARTWRAAAAACRAQLP